jgi:NAD(P)-dependent dehydrogenase (short-subunit alcohol dehydrogenase family)
VADLIERAWNVVVADIQPPSEQLEGTKYIQTDVGSWDSQADMFAAAYAWQGRLDFAALNAGIGDRDDIFLSLSYDPSKPPVKPNMQTFDIDLVGVYYGVKLAAHYMTLPSSDARKPQIGGKIVMTASGAGLFGLPAMPQYTAAKYGVVGLARALGIPYFGDRAEKHNITINAVCPAIIDTPLVPRTSVEVIGAANITPMSTVLRAFEELALLTATEEYSSWLASGPSGETLLATGDRTISISAPPTGAEQDAKIRGLDQGYRELNLRFTLENEQKHRG